MGCFYLRVPIFKACPKPSNWIPIVDKIKARVNSWGASWLNPAGKVFLIKALLSIIPIYQCSILLAPKGIISLIEKTCRSFLWNGGKQTRKKLSLVSWGGISMPLLGGGLQLRDLRRQNLALGAKILRN